MGMNWVGLIRRVVQDGIRSGELHGNARRIAMALMGAHVVYTMSFVLRGKPALNRALARDIVDLLFTGCSGTRSRKAS
jgi:hypothetical protein